MTRKQKNVLNFLGLIFLLIVLPLGAIYLLDKGINYRKNLIGTLEDYGKMPEFSLSDYTEIVIDNERLKRGLTVVNFMSLTEKETSDIKGAMISKIHQQFDDREDIYFLNFVLDGSIDSTNMLYKFIEQHNLEDEEQCFFISGESDMLERMASTGFKIPVKEGELLKKSPYVAFVDANQQIRKYYDMGEEEDVKLLVQHLMLLLPVVNQRKGKYEVEE